MKRKFALSIAALALLAGAVCVQAAVDSSPSGVVKELVGTIRGIQEPKEDEPPLDPVQLEKNRELTTEVSQMMDIRGLARYVLWEHWDKRTSREQEDFVELLREVLETVAYPDTASFLRDLEMTVRKEKMRSSKAMVYTSVMHEKEGRIDIDFKLEQNEQKWLLTDVYLDGVSLARNLRTRCQKIIREDSFEELMNRLQEKLEKEEDSEFDDIAARN